MISPNAVPPRNSLRGQERSPMRRRPFHADPLRGADRSFLPRSSRMPSSRHRTPITKTVVAQYMPGPRANVSRSMSVLLLDAFLALAPQVGRCHAGRDAHRRCDAECLRVAPLRGRQRLVEAALVPEIGLRAPEAGVARLDGEARSGV